MTAFLGIFDFFQLQKVLWIAFYYLPPQHLIFLLLQLGDTLSLKTGGAYYNGFIDNLTFCVKLLATL